LASDQLQGEKLTVVEDPQMSRRANEMLAEQMRVASGARELELLPPDHPRAGPPPRRPSRLDAALWDTRVLLGTCAAMLVVVVAVIALGSEKAWTFVVAVAVLLLMTWLVIRRYFVGAGEGEHLDPATAADLQAEGVLDPDGLFNRRMLALRRK
jgi:hypothetical protein